MKKSVNRLLLAAGLSALELLAPAPVRASGEGRVELSQADFVQGTYTVRVSGSYVLTENIYITGGVTAIMVLTNDVTIDLNGFGIYGPNVDSTYGIMVPLVGGGGEQYSGVTVCNGTLANWGLDIGGGVYSFGHGLRLHDLKVYGCYEGIYSYGAAIVERCVLDSNAVGIVVSSGSVVADCTVRNSRDAGVYLSGAVGDAVTDNRLINAENSALSHCQVADCVETGIWAGGRTVLYRCASLRAGREGIRCGNYSLADGCSVAGAGVDGLVLETNAFALGCTVQASRYAGFLVWSGGVVSACASVTNGDDGIELVYGSTRVTENVAERNGLSGIWGRTTCAGSHIQNNHTLRNQLYGIELTSPATNNLVIKNSAGANGSGDYNLSAGNSVGPITSDESNQYETANFDL